MNFTQFLFPNGRKSPVTIDMDPETERMANKLNEACWNFEIEINPDTQLVHMDCCDDDGVLSNRLVRNGPNVPIKVKELVAEAYSEWEKRGKPKAHGRLRPTEWEAL